MRSGLLIVRLGKLPDQFLKAIRRKGRREIVALYDITAHLLERVKLFLFLYPFRDDGHAEERGDIHHQLDEAEVLVIDQHAADKLHIDL